MWGENEFRKYKKPVKKKRAPKPLTADQLGKVLLALDALRRGQSFAVSGTTMRMLLARGFIERLAGQTGVRITDAGRARLEQGFKGDKPK